MLIEELIDLAKVRTDSLKFRKDLPDLVMDGWSVTHWSVIQLHTVLVSFPAWLSFWRRFSGVFNCWQKMTAGRKWKNS